MRQGYTVIQCGWQEDVPPEQGRLRLHPPQLRGHAQLGVHDEIREAGVAAPNDGQQQTTGVGSVPSQDQGLSGSDLIS